MQVVREPTPETALDFLRSELASLQAGRGHLVQIVAACAIQYQGRARSILHRGERLILLKPDGTLLVHTASKAKPVNWQPPGASFDAVIQDGALVLTAYRRKPEEMVKITFHEITLLLAVPLHDAAELALVGTEDDLQAILFDHPALVEDGFVPRRRERDAKRGFYDIDGHDAEGRRVIVEVKRGTAGVKEAQQLWRYVEQERGTESRVVRGILIAPKIAPKARSLLHDHEMEWREIDWDDVLPKVEAMRRGGQVGLGRFG